jgi:hypothetical protein
VIGYNDLTKNIKDGLKFPTGTTSERGNPSKGSLRFNSETGKPEIYAKSRGWKSGVAEAGSLYPFTSAFFTVSQALTDSYSSTLHRYGPSETQVRSWLSGSSNGGGSFSWANTYVDCPVQGYQRWTIPQSGTYRITVKGAGSGQTDQAWVGRGVKVIADFNLVKSEHLILAAGQGVPNFNGDHCNGGGGASWVMRGKNYVTAIPLIVAAGSAGDTSDGGNKQQPNIALGQSITVTPTAQEGGGASVTGKQTTPILSSAIYGRGGINNYYACSAGWLTDGLDPSSSFGVGGHCFRTDLIGGNGSNSTAGHGGFGGGSGGFDEFGNAGGGFTGAHGEDNTSTTGQASSFVNDANQGNVSVALALASSTYQNSDYTSEDQYQGWIKIELIA